MQCLIIIWLRNCLLAKIVKCIVRIYLLVISPSAYFDKFELIKNNPCPRLIKTIYFNLRLCKLKDAIHMPIYIYGDTRIMQTSGSISFTCPVKSGIIDWGKDWGHRSVGATRIHVAGTIYFGGRTVFLQGSDVEVFVNATLSLGNDVLLGENCLLYCMKKIEIGDNVRLPFQTSIMDTDFHYTLSIEKRAIYPKEKAIKIGNNVWVGNRATIKKGAVLPDYTIVAGSYSLVTKDFSDLPPFSIVGGVPAKLIKSGSVRTWHNELQRIAELDSWFKNHPTEKFYPVAEEENLEDYYIGNINESK